MGLGDHAARAGASSTVRQAQFRQLALMDQVAREVTEAHAQSQARRQQIEIAQAGVAAAINSHRRNLARIEQAKGLPIEALQSLKALAFAQREYLRTLVDYDTAQFRLLRALGWPVPETIGAQTAPGSAPTNQPHKRVGNQSGTKTDSLLLQAARPE